MSQPFSHTIIADPSGNTFILSVNDGGALVATANPGAEVAGNVLVDNGGTAWELSLTSLGQLQITAVVKAGAKSKLYSSSGGYLWTLTALPGGGIMTAFAGMGKPDVRVGTLDPPNDAYPKFTQPGGPGTTTYPQQQSGGPSSWDGIPNELGQGLWTAGCGHWFNNILVQSEAVLGIQSAILCCPICSFVCMIVTPYRLIHTDSYFILFV